MKKLLIVIITIIILVSCESKVIQQPYRPKFKKGDIVTFKIDTSVKGMILEDNGNYSYGVRYFDKMGERNYAGWIKEYELIKK